VSGWHEGFGVQLVGAGLHTTGFQQENQDRKQKVPPDTASSSF
jgi:hypothetical protein